MKKFAMAAVAAAAMTVGVAHAYTAGTFSNGVVVPNVIHNGGADTTAVGLINQSTSAGAGVTRAVFWTFFDQDSNHVTDGCFTMTNKDYQPFVWSDPALSGGNTAGKRGYLVFALGGTADCANVAPSTSSTDLLAAHAFQVNLVAKDVAYTPVIDGPLTIGSTDLTKLGPDSLTKVGGAAQTIPGSGEVGAKFNMRYYLQDGAKTNIVVWSTGDQTGSHTVNIFDDKQNRKSVNFDLTKKELDWFNPDPIVGRPSTYVDGFIEWDAATAPKLGLVGSTLGNASVFSYSVIDAPAFGAVQTVLGFHRN